MSALYGIDGCKKGWLVVRLEKEQFSVNIWASLDAFCEAYREGDVAGIDMPIGLPDRTQPVRECDRLARRCLGSRHVCVFSPPSREALHETTRESASVINEKETDRMVSCQVWGIRDKLKEIDRLFVHGHPATAVFHEVHPEVTFAHWCQVTGRLGAPMPFTTSKKRSKGRKERRELIDKTWRGAVERMKQQLKDDGAKGWAEDDLIDEFACLWTAKRIAAGNSISYPALNNTPTDAKGLIMRINA